MTDDTSENNAGVVCIAYNDLVSACQSNDTTSINALIEKAFGSGPSCLGIVAITDVPKLPSLRMKLLPLAQKLATLSSDQLNEVTVPESEYQVGWSHGREKLEGNKPDFSKGSFYANPLTQDLAESMLERRKYQRTIPNDDGGERDAMMEEVLKWEESFQHIQSDEELCALAKANPAFFARNVWPTKSLPDLESAFMEVGKVIHKIGSMVAKCCDSYVSAQCPGYEPKLEQILCHSKCCKARLLHYFPTEDDAADESTEDKVDDTQFSNWCGWHNDHGSLTGLLPAMYLDSAGKFVKCPDDKAGLYIKSRNGALVHAKLPEGAIAFQIGETSQIHTGGILQATPHAVRGCKGGNVSRETFAIFMEPEYHSRMKLPEGRTLEDTQRIESEQYLPRTVRTLRSRWKLGMNFGEFSNATFAAFH